MTRSSELTEKYLNFIDQHVSDVLNGRTDRFMQLNEIASKLAISHTHLTDTVQKERGNHPCYFYDAKIIDKAKELLLKSNLSISNIALQLTYDPSNFSKFFKKWTGNTPGKFREIYTKNP